MWSSVKGSAAIWSKVWPREVVPAAPRAIVEWDVEIYWRSGRSRRGGGKGQNVRRMPEIQQVAEHVCFSDEDSFVDWRGCAKGRVGQVSREL